MMYRSACRTALHSCITRQEPHENALVHHSYEQGACLERGSLLYGMDADDTALCVDNDPISKSSLLLPGDVIIKTDTHIYAESSS